MTAARGPDRRFFDLWSLFYDWPVVQRLTYRPGHDLTLRILREVCPERVLDVGCGTGQLASRLRCQLAPARVVGCDFSRGMLRHAAGHAADGLWVQGNAMCLPFGDAAFDAVVSTEAFHWFPDPRAALAEFHRVLEPGGRLLVALVNPPTELQSRAAAAASRLVGEPFRWPTRRTMREVVEEAGFRVEAQRFVFRLPLALTFPTILTEAVREG
jgi:SAM-dependent methyltransferase